MIIYNNPKEKKLHDDLVELVEVMFDLQKQGQEADGYELEQLKPQIEKTGREIDERVYELYGVTQGERRLIEGDKTR